MRILRLVLLSVLFSFAVSAVVYSNAYFFGCGTQTSSPGTVVTTVGPQIVDSAGNVWTLNSSRQVVLNGTADGTTNRVYEIAWVYGQIYQENYVLEWYYKTIPPTGAWTPTNNPLPIAAPTPVPLAVLYVNNTKSCPGNGSSGQPFCSIQNAIGAVAAGTDIRIQNTGTTYNESDTLSTAGTVAHPITFEADNPASPPTLTNTVSVGQASSQLLLNNVSYVTIQNLKWDGTGLNVAEYAIHAGNNTTTLVGINILNNTFTNWASSNTTVSYTGLGNAAVRLGNFTSGGNSITFNVQGNTFTGSRYTALESTSPINSTVLNNTFSGTVCGYFNGTVGPNTEWGNETIREDCYTGGAESGANIVTNTLYQGNVISNMNASCPLTPPPISPGNGNYGEWAGIHVDDNCSGMVFKDNVMHDMAAPNLTGYPTTYAGLHYEQHTAAGAVLNNLFHDFTGGSWTGGARAVYVLPDSWINGTNAPFTIAGNTVYGVAGNGGDAFTCEDGCTVVRDNIALDNGGVGYAYLTPTGPSCSQCSFDYDLEWDASGGVRYGRVDYLSGPITFAAWKSATGGDAHSINSDPLLSAPTSQNFLQTASSPTLDTGVAVTNFISDILGVTRPSPPSMGAYEYPF